MAENHSAPWTIEAPLDAVESCIGGAPFNITSANKVHEGLGLGEGMLEYIGPAISFSGYEIGEPMGPDRITVAARGAEALRHIDAVIAQ